MQLRDYKRLRDGIDSAIREVQAVARELGVDDTVNYLEMTRSELEDQSFLLTVVGEFSHGKSTFINALLGTEILPSKVRPSTAMINKIYHNEEPVFSLSFRTPGSEPRSLDFEQFKTLLAPMQPDEENEQEVQTYEQQLDYFRSISMAEVGYPGAICKAGVEIYDTPGTNDIDETREEITYSFVPKSDAVIFLLKATAPFAATEMEFLKDRILSEHIHKVFFVLNFKDRIETSEQQEKIARFVQEKLATVVDNPRVYLVSALGALTLRRMQNQENVRSKIRYTTMEETGFLELEADLAHFFETERGLAKVSKPVGRLKKRIDELLQDTLALRIAGTKLEIEKINQGIEELKPRIMDFRSLTKGITERLLSGLHYEEAQLVQLLEQLLQDMADTVLTSVDRYNGEWTDDAIESFVRRQVVDSQKQIYAKLNAAKATAIKPLIEQAYKGLHGAEQGLNDSIKDALQLEVDFDYSFTISTASTEFDLGDLSGLLLGAGVLALLAAPWVVIGGIASWFFFRESSESQQRKEREQKRDQVKQAVRKGFTGNRGQVTQSFKTEWKKLIREIDLSFQQEIHEKVVRLEDELHRMRLDKEKERYNAEEQRAQYEKMAMRLERVGKDVQQALDEFSYRIAGVSAALRT